MKLSNLLLPLAVQAATTKPTKEQKKQIKEEREFKKNTQEVGWELLFRSGTSNENKVISPLCVMGAMYMLAAGAAGDTQREILDKMTNTEGQDAKDVFKKFSEVIAFHSDESNEHALHIANGVFTNDNMLDENYSNLLTNDDYKLTDSAAIKIVDFENESEQATKTINDWISKNTNGMIDPMYAETLDPDMAILLSSTLYFKGAWDAKFTTEFSEEQKHANCWQKNIGDTTTCDENVEFIQHNGNYKSVNVNNGAISAQVIEVPMKLGKFEFEGSDYENQMTFQIWYPNNDIREPDNDKAMQDLLRSKGMKVRTISSYSAGPRSIKLTMPKFEIDFDQDIKELMNELGVSKVFGREKDLTPMVGDNNNDIDISKINHKVKFELDENGVEGAAAANVEITFRSFSTPTPIVLTRPFYFTVSPICRNKSKKNGCKFGNIPIFVGKVTDPSAL